MKKFKGVTIMETLVSLAILAAIISIVMFNLVSSTRREDIRYFQGRVNINNRMEMVDSITESMAKTDMILKTDYTLNDIGYYSIINGRKEYIVNLNNYDYKIINSTVDLSSIVNRPNKPESFEREIDVNGTKSKVSLPVLTFADTLIYNGFYVRSGTDAETMTTTIINTFNKNIDTIEIVSLNTDILSEYHLNRYLNKTNINAMQYLYTTNETVEFTRSLNIIKKGIGN